LHFYAVGDRIAEVLQFLVRRAGRDEEAADVTCGETSDDARAGDGALAYRDYVCQFGLEDRGKVLGVAEAEEAVGVCESRKDADAG